MRSHNTEAAHRVSGHVPCITRSILLHTKQESTPSQALVSIAGASCSLAFRMQPHSASCKPDMIEVEGPPQPDSSFTPDSEQNHVNQNPKTPSEDAEKTRDASESPETPSDSTDGSPPPQPSTPSPEHLRSSQAHADAVGRNEKSKKTTGLPPGWTVRMSKSRRLHYFAHKATGRTSWRPPHGTDKEVLQTYLWTHWDDFDPVLAKKE